MVLWDDLNKDPPVHDYLHQRSESSALNLMIGCVCDTAINLRTAILPTLCSSEQECVQESAQRHSMGDTAIIIIVVVCRQNLLRKVLQYGPAIAVGEEVSRGLIGRNDSYQQARYECRVESIETTRNMSLSPTSSGKLQLLVMHPIPAPYNASFHLM